MNGKVARSMPPFRSMPREGSSADLMCTPHETTQQKQDDDQEEPEQRIMMEKPEEPQQQEEDQKVKAYRTVDSASSSVPLGEVCAAGMVPVAPAEEEEVPTQHHCPGCGDDQGNTAVAPASPMAPIDISGKLYDRGEQQRVLLDGYQRVRAQLIGLHQQKDALLNSSREAAIAQQPMEKSLIPASPPTQLFLINAASGMGKTALATSIKQYVTEDGAFFVSGKFAHSLVVALQQHHRKPLGPVIEALVEWVDQLWEDPNHAVIMRQLQSRLGQRDSDDLQVLLEEVPALASLLNAPHQGAPAMGADSCGNALGECGTVSSIGGIHTSGADKLRDNSNSNINTGPPLRRTSTSDSKKRSGSQASNKAARRPSLTGGGTTAPSQHQAQSQLGAVLRRFLRLICRLGRPLVLLLDDLQWADASSLELLGSILDPSVPEAETYPGLMVIATCRSNEVNFQHPLSEMLRGAEDRGASIVDVQLHHLGVPALSHMISDALGAPTDECKMTAAMVLEKTHGNALFAQQYIQALLQERQKGNDRHRNTDSDSDGGLGMSAEDCSTVGRLSEVESLASFSQSEDEHFVRWLASQMRRMPRNARYLIKVISCLGGTFDTIELLQRTSNLELDDLHKALMLSVDRHFLTYDSSVQSGGFAHDKYQEAAHNLVSDEYQRSKLYVQLGLNLQSKCHENEGEFEEYLVLIVDLLLRGRDEIKNEEDRDRLALWCFEAGRLVAGKSAFTGSHALDYMEHGIELLARRHWRDQYDLSLALFNAAAELAYGQGNHKRVEELVHAIKQNARSFMDTVQALSLSIYSIGATGDIDRAIDVAFDVLDELGFPLPKDLTHFGIQWELFRTKRMLKRVSERDILDLPIMEDRKAMAAMTVIQMLHPFFTTANPQNAALTGSRLVRLTLQYGFSPISNIGFSMYALSLTRWGRIPEGHKYGQLTLQLMERQRCIECESKVFLSLGVGPVFAKRPFHEANDLMVKSHFQGIQTGDLETAMRAHFCTSVMGLLMGTPLPIVAEHLREGNRFSDDYSSEFTKGISVPYVEIVTLLMPDQNASSGKRNVKQFCLEAKHETVRVYKIFGYCFFAMYMNQLDFAQQLMSCLQDHKAMLKSLLPISQVLQLFVEGMIAAALGRKNKDKGMLRKARRRLRELRKLKVYNPCNYSNKVSLIRAELEASAGRKHTALSLYDEAIELAEKEGFIHEQALACEKAGRILLEWDRKAEGLEYLAQARDLYEEWGATAKLSQLSRLLKYGGKPPTNFMSSTVSSNRTRSDI